MDRNVAAVDPLSSYAVLPERRVADGWCEPSLDLVPLDTCVWCPTSGGELVSRDRVLWDPT